MYLGFDLMYNHTLAFNASVLMIYLAYVYRWYSIIEHDTTIFLFFFTIKLEQGFCFFPPFLFFFYFCITKYQFCGIIVLEIKR